MIKEATGIGATPEEALANARAALGAPFDAEVHTEIIEMPKKKILGLFGGAPAKARAYYEVAEEKKPQPKAKAPSQKAAKAEKAAKKAEEKKEPVQVKEKEAEEIRKSVALDSNSTLKAAADYLKEIVTGMGVAQVSIEAFETGENEVILELDCGEDYGVVIGRRGETLDAIQYLTRLSANKKKGDSDYARISVNVGNYREKRKNTLSELAKKNASKVLKYGRNVTFEPMNPYERRIIHTTIQEIEGVTSYSVGSDSDRRVVITLAEGVKPTHPSKGSYNRGRGGKGGYNNRGRDRRNNTYTPSEEATARAPRTDAGAQKVSLYGKIN